MSIGCRINTKYIRPDKVLIEKFRNAAVANLGDCMNRTACMDFAMKPVNKSPLLGCVFTVKVPEGDNLMVHKAMDLAQPGDVLVIDAGGGRDRAIFGEIMVNYCISKKLGGMIVDGSIRDFEVLSKLDFPVYAKGVSPNGPYKNGPGEIGMTVSCGGQIVYPGDIIIGDMDGVIAIRPDDALHLLEMLHQVEEKERAILNLIESEGKYQRPWVDEKLKEIGCEYI